MSNQKTFVSPPTHIMRPRSQPMTLRQKMQMAQHTGLRARKEIKISLPKEPWEENEWEKQQSSQSD